MSNPNDIAEKIDGVWVMDKMATTFVGGAEEEHPGASGQLIYDAKLGTVFAHITRSDDKSPNGELRFEYIGAFELSPESDNEITHHIQWATKPKIIGMALKRSFNLSGDGKRLAIIGQSSEYKDAQIKIDWVKLEQ